MTSPVTHPKPPGQVVQEDAKARKLRVQVVPVDEKARKKLPDPVVPAGATGERHPDPAVLAGGKICLKVTGGSVGVESGQTLSRRRWLAYRNKPSGYYQTGTRCRRRLW
jgi:hypothetical protein